jgi:hypothetical protein
MMMMAIAIAGLSYNLHFFNFAHDWASVHFGDALTFKRPHNDGNTTKLEKLTNYIV